MNVSLPNLVSRDTNGYFLKNFPEKGASIIVRPVASFVQLVMFNYI